MCRLKYFAAARPYACLCFSNVCTLMHGYHIHKTINIPPLIELTISSQMTVYSRLYTKALLIHKRDVNASI